MANSSYSHPNHSLAIGLGVGLAVGVPVLLTFILLIWVTIRHRRRIREEDEEHEKIDFNGEVSFWSLDDKSQVPSDETTKQTADSMYELDIPGQRGNHLSSPSLRSPSMRTSSIRGSLWNGSTGSAPAVPPLSVYAPSIDGCHDEQQLSRQLNSVYGPSPAYPSTERLRMASTGSLTSHHIPRTPGMHYGDGPFATPPRIASSERRMSNGSLQASSLADSEIRPAGCLHEVKETPHPYADLAGETALNTGAVPVPDNTIETEPRERGKHVYHTQAENRESVFEY